MKRIIVTCDGTWNAPERNDPRKNHPTNVLKLTRLLKPRDNRGREQVVEYVSGIGSYNVLERWVGGMGGYGIERHIRQAYQFIAHNYATGDHIFLFGFSRGAYTARSLAGLLDGWGILPKDQMHRFAEVYKAYSQKERSSDYKALFEEIHNSSQKRKGQGEQRLVTEDNVRTPVCFLGVWDTVGSLGFPTPILKWWYRNKYDYHVVNLTKNITAAYHALSIHELRRYFQPNLWVEACEGQQVEQTWFAGSHSDIGGGQEYNDLSNISLKWMIARAKDHGLEFIDQEVNALTSNYEHPIEISIASFPWYLLGGDTRSQISNSRAGCCQSIHQTASQRLKAITDRPNCYPRWYRTRLNMADNLSNFGKLPIVSDSESLKTINERENMAKKNREKEEQEKALEKAIQESVYLKEDMPYEGPLILPQKNKKPSEEGEEANTDSLSQ